MVGVGPFVTLPLIITTTGGSQAVFGWLLGALLTLRRPHLERTWYRLSRSRWLLRLLQTSQRRSRPRHLVPLPLAAPFQCSASIASGCIGFSRYLSYFIPHLQCNLSLAAILGPGILSSWRSSSACISDSHIVSLLLFPAYNSFCEDCYLRGLK
jgi:hypothetical protein